MSRDITVVSEGGFEPPRPIGPLGHQGTKVVRSRSASSLFVLVRTPVGVESDALVRDNPGGFVGISSEQ